MRGIDLRHGDCLEVMASLPDESVHAVVTDPPYNLSFMSREWDTHASAKAFQAWCEAWAAECLRVLRPGGHLLAFGGTRTGHRLAAGVEDAGFEIRDSIAWLHSQGFPKAKGQMKPAFEPIVVARKPLQGTVAANVLAHGTGALNIDGCRVAGPPSGLKPYTWSTENTIYNGTQSKPDTMMGVGAQVNYSDHPAGRWPANVALDGAQADALDQMSGTLKSGDLKPYVSASGKRGGIMGET